MIVMWPSPRTDSVVEATVCFVSVIIHPLYGTLSRALPLLCTHCLWAACMPSHGALPKHSDILPANHPFAPYSMSRVLPQRAQEREAKTWRPRGTRVSCVERRHL